MKALVVVDYQNDHVTGPLGSKYAPLIENNICKRIEDVLMSRGDVYFVIDYFEENFMTTVNGVTKPVNHCLRGSKGAELYGRVEDFSSKGYLLRKTSPGSNELMRMIARYDEIELCGVETDVGVLANAIIARAANPKANVIVRQNCVASRNTDLSEYALDIMNGMGIKVM